MTDINLPEKVVEGEVLLSKKDKKGKRTLQLIQTQEILDLKEAVQAFNTDGTVKELLIPKMKEIIDEKELEVTNIKWEDCYFFKINSLSYDEDYPHREALENVIMSLDNEAYNFVYILDGTKKGVSLYLGVVKNTKENDKNMSHVNDYGELIQEMFKGNFNGSVLDRLYKREIEEVILGRAKQFTSKQNLVGKQSIAGLIVGIPSINEKEAGETKDFQGMDRLINSMKGIDWRLVIVCEPVSTSDVVKMQNEIYNLYNRLYVSSKVTRQKSFSDGQTVSFGKNSGKTLSKNKSTQESESKTHSQGSQTEYSNKSDSTTKNLGVTSGIGESENTGEQVNVAVNNGSSDAVTIEEANKHAVEMMKYIDEELLERVKSGIIKGLYNTSVFYMAEYPAYANRLKNAIISLFQGNKSTYSPLIAKELKAEDITKGILGYYQNLRERTDASFVSKDITLLYGRPYEKGEIGLSTLLTLKEVSLLAGFPQQEVPGLKLKEEVKFGLNADEIEDNITLGNIVQKGRELEDVPFVLGRKSINKHIFIAGVTGSGKTTTCQKLLKEAGKNIPFLVIEPAKTEYRALLKHNDFEELTVFTLGNETVAPFRLNPFEIVEGENISSHIDMIKATFTAAFPMEGSMPQMLEEAIYDSYKDKGWDIENNRYEKNEDPFHSDEPCFPIISDLLEHMKGVVEKKHFGDRLENEYLGSLVSRLSNLTVGAKGRMLNCERSIDFNYLAEHNVVLEMEDLKNPEDKSLFMGFILSRLSAVIRNKSKQNKNYKHITLIEEAHRLLSKVEYGDSGSKKTSVETFTDLLAEVRKYGEGLIIVDQIPNKLAADVLKNTNTKIVHRIFAKDDKEVIGDTMMMDDKQKEFLSSLPIGHTIVFAENTDKPVHIKIKAGTNTSEAEVSDKEVKERFNLNRKNFGSCLYGYNMFLQDVYPKIPEIYKKMTYYKDKYDDIKKQILNVVRKYGNEVILNDKDTDTDGKEEKVWRDLVKLYYDHSGKGDDCGTERENYEKRLTRFLSETCAEVEFEKKLSENFELQLDFDSLL